MATRVSALGSNGGPGLPLTLKGVEFLSEIDFTLPLAGPVSTEFEPISPKQSVRKSDQGIRVVVAVVNGAGEPINVRNASSLVIRLLKPDASGKMVTGSLFSNGRDGKIQFVSTVTIPPFDQTGEWWIQAQIVIGGVSQSTQWSNFVVEPNI